MLSGKRWTVASRRSRAGRSHCAFSVEVFNVRAFASGPPPRMSCATHHVAVLAEHRDGWQVSRHCFSAQSMALLDEKDRGD